MNERSEDFYYQRCKENIINGLRQIGVRKIKRDPLDIIVLPADKRLTVRLAKRFEISQEQADKIIDEGAASVKK